MPATANRLPSLLRTAIAVPRRCSRGSRVNRTSAVRIDVHAEARQDQVRTGVPAAAHDDEIAAPRQLGAQRAPAQEPRRLLDEDDVRFGGADDPPEGVPVVAHGADVVREHAQADHCLILPDRCGTVP